MKTAMIASAIVIGVFAAGSAGASEALAKSSGCLGCHAVDTKKVGPSFKEIAAKYKGKDTTESMLTDKIGAAKAHPKTKASPEELKTLVKWVLSM
jgi:cytochrome c